MKIAALFAAVSCIFLFVSALITGKAGFAGNVPEVSKTKSPVAFWCVIAFYVVSFCVSVDWLLHH